jgi:hypothetical protein
VLRYRTQIEIPADRCVCLLLPRDFPEGPATVTFQSFAATPIGAHPDREPDPDRDDIEWWEEFDDEPEKAE